MDVLNLAASFCISFICFENEAPIFCVALVIFVVLFTVEVEHFLNAASNCLDNATNLFIVAAALPPTLILKP